MREQRGAISQSIPRVVPLSWLANIWIATVCFHDERQGSASTAFLKIDWLSWLLTPFIFIDGEFY